MMGDRARSALGESLFADLRWVEETGSTNDDVSALAAQGMPEGVTVVADHQTAGRGRLGRSWQAPSGSSLLMSVLLRPRLDPALLHLLTMAMATSALGAVRELAEVSARLKWPNDLVVESDAGTRKLAGILAESDLGTEPPTVVVGLGLNVEWPEVVPEELVGLAVALNHLTAEPVDREDLAARILLGLERRYADLDRPPGRNALLGEYRECCSTLGRRVRVEMSAERLEGTAVDITSEGHLLVDAGGLTRELAAGDVVHLR